MGKHSKNKSAELQQKLAILPESPGVYTYYDAEGTVIYVGKAKNLKRRVSSYFNRTHDVLRTNLLVRAIADLSYIVVPTEQDALNLENSMIKEYQPRYNVLLKDDKSYPYVKVTVQEEFPRVFITRRVVKDGYISTVAAAVAGSPVLGVPRGSMSRTWSSSSATGRCSTPRGTTYMSPGPRSTEPLRSSIRIRPASIRKNSSVSSCRCQLKTPLTFTSIRLFSLNVPTVRGM